MLTTGILFSVMNLLVFCFSFFACVIEESAVDAICHRVATLSCRGHDDELATEPFLLLQREHGTGYRQS